VANTFTKLYLTNATATFDPATTKGAWTSTSSKVTKALDSQKNDRQGDTTTVTATDTVTTNPNKILLYQGISGPLAGQTISGNINVVIPILESSASADFNWGVHVWVTQGNSASVRGTLLTDYNEALGTNEWPTTITAKQLNAATAMSSLAVTAGDRMVVEIGIYARNTVSTSFTATLRYGTCDATSHLAFASDLANGDTGTNLTTKAPYLTFSSAITEDTVTGQLSQVARETVLDTNPSVQLSQLVRETVIDTNPPAQLSQLVREIVISGATVITFNSSWAKGSNHVIRRKVN